MRLTPPAVHLDVIPVTTRRDLDRFVDLPWQLFDQVSHPQWVPPLRATVYDALDQSRHPFYRDAARALFLAVRGGRVIGRIAAIENPAHNRFHGDRVGFWGFFECVNHQKVADALFGAATRWLGERGLDVLRGPMNPSTNYECGLLIDGFEHRPSFMTTWNPPYYAELCDRAGMQKAKDLVAYHIPMGDQSWTMPPAFERVAARALGKSRIAFRDLDLRRFDQELEVCWDVYNAAWERNWGFVPMSKDEFVHTARDMKPLLNPRYAFAAEVDGMTVGFMLAVPDYSAVLQRIGTGRLFPTGAIRLWLGKRKIHEWRVMALGLRPEYRARGILPLFAWEGYRRGREAGEQGAEASWILEDNEPMNRPMIGMGVNVYRRWRIYDRGIRASLVRVPGGA
ncbi:MAG: N-acetyltransferase [Gemmatimonadaceae bacterium]